MLSSKITKDGLAVHGNDLPLVICSETRGAVVPGTPLYPAYYLLMGLSIEAPKPLVFLVERENMVEEELFESLRVDVEAVRCETLYVGVALKAWHDSFYQMLTSFLENRETPIAVWNAPYAEKPERGVAILRNWMAKGRLLVPEGTVVRRHLRIRAEEKEMDLGDSKYGFHALRYILGGCEVQPELHGSFSMEWERLKHKELRESLDSTSYRAWAELDQIRKREVGDDDDETEYWE